MPDSTHEHDGTATSWAGSLSASQDGELARALVGLSANDLARAVRLWDDATANRLQAGLRDELARLPIPAFHLGSFELVRMRDRLALTLGALDARAGDAAPLLAAARREWVRGSSHAAYLRLLHDHGETSHALSLAFSLLEEPPSSARNDESAALRAFVHDALGLPPGFETELAALGAAPSLDGWLALRRFWPGARAERGGPASPASPSAPSVPSAPYGAPARRSSVPPPRAPSNPDPERIGAREGRVRYSLLRLLELGVSPDSVFSLVASEGVSDVLSRFVEGGLVQPASIVAFAEELSREERADFLGLALRGAAVRGEAFLVRRYLREARAAGRAPAELDEDLAFARARGNAAVRQMLVSVTPSGGSPDLDA